LSRATGRTDYEYGRALQSGAARHSIDRFESDVQIAGLFSLRALLKGAFSLMFLPNGKKPTAEESVTLHACRMRNYVFT
jgi:hypothetical protein